MKRKQLLSVLGFVVLGLMLMLVFTRTTRVASAVNPSGANNAAQPSRHPGDVSFLTGPNSGTPLEIVQNYLDSHKADYGLTAADLADVIVTNQYTDAHNGVTHIYMRQRYQGIEITTANLSSHVTSDGRIINLYSTFVGNLATVINTTTPSLSAQAAVGEAAPEFGLALTKPLTILEGPSGPDSRMVLSDGGISARPISARLIYHVGASELRLSWELEIETLDFFHYWVVSIDALNGQLLNTEDRVISEDFGVVEEGTTASHNTESFGGTVNNSAPAQSNASAPDQYEVYAMPSEYPDDGPRVVVVDPAHPSASPFGWHDTNGAAGAEFTITRGNNVNAYQDQDADGNPEPGEQPDGGATLDFTGALVPLNLANDPLTYVNAAVTNLFYWNNIIHDVFHGYGFNEVSGNFQVNNYGNGGLGNDAVQAQAQDGSDTNNARFFSTVDGSQPRMEMYLWNVTSPRRDGDLESSIIAHEYGHGISQRLTGGPSTVSCLSNNEQMGEGWSDFFGLVLTAKASDTATTVRGLGTYVLGQPVTGGGIRPAPYTYDMTVNTYTYANLPGMAIPHGVGFVWATMTWDMYWNLVTDHGFNPDFYGDWTTGGNNLAIQLIMDGLKLQPCSPGFVDGRNAILQADVNLTGGANQCAIWEAFARRGLGFSASQGNSTSTTDGTPAFDLPSTCSGGPTPTPTTAPPTATATTAPPTATPTSTPEAPTPTATSGPTGVDVSDFGSQSNSGTFLVFATILMLALFIGAFFLYRKPADKSG